MDNPLILITICWLVPLLTAGALGYALGARRLRVEWRPRDIEPNGR